MKITTFTISVDELIDVISITDPSVREAAISAIRSAASDPDSIPDSPAGEAAPVLLRIRRKAISRARAKARREQKARLAEKIRKDPDGHSVQVPLSESTCRRILWLKQHMGETFDNLIRVISQVTAGVDLKGDPDKKLQIYYRELQTFFRPLFRAASGYMSLPRHRRLADSGVYVTLTP